MVELVYLESLPISEQSVITAQNFVNQGCGDGLAKSDCLIIAVKSVKTDGTKGAAKQRFPKTKHL